MASIADPVRDTLGPLITRRSRRGHPALTALAWGTALVVLLPLAALAAIAARGSGALWPHLIDHVLPWAAAETALLLLGTAVVVIGLGVGTAWLVAAYQFPGRRFLSWALVLPLATPVYIVAYAYLDLLHPAGLLQSGLRALFGASGPQALRLPEFRSLGGGVLLFGFVLYPYVYLNARAAFQMQSAEAIEAARMLGASGLRLMTMIAVPLAWPAIAAGGALALMETLADLGACEQLGIQSLTVSVYVTWATRGSVEGAAQIALAMLAPVALLLLLTYRRRGDRANSATAARPLAARRLGPVAGIAAAAACALPVLLGFAIPAAHLVRLAGARLAEHGLSPALLGHAWSSARFALVATVATLAAGFILAFCQRTLRLGAPVRIAQLGYAVPGTVLAVGLLGVLSAVDAAIGLLGVVELRGALVLASATGVILAYVARFLAIPAGALEAGFAKLPRALDEAARIAGAGPLRLARGIHWPLLRPALCAAALLLAIECIRELPATLLLRPLNTETLATFLYGEASRGVYEDGAVAALAIVALGLLPIILLSRAADGVQRR